MNICMQNQTYPVLSVANFRSTKETCFVANVALMPSYNNKINLFRK